jgi:hypothetical protein
MKKSKLISIHGASSWELKSDRVELNVSETGGHVGPVSFHLPGRQRAIQPYALAPWQATEADPSAPAILKVLRGDFFCLPFGVDRKRSYQKELHPPHGETCNRSWKWKDAGKGQDTSWLDLEMQTSIRAGNVIKHLELRKGHAAVYSSHAISGMKGPMTLGVHPILQFPPGEGSGLISTSGFQFGQVFPELLENPDQRGYSCLKPGSFFQDLKRVPKLDGDMADLSSYPQRAGYDDLVMLATKPCEPFAWSAVSFPKQRYVWFNLKDASILNSTVFWMANGGRHYAPWNGNYRGCMGIEEITGYFDYGIADSLAKNPWSAKGHPTHQKLNSKKNLELRLISGVAAIPAGFDSVQEIVPEKGKILLRSVSGKQVRVPLDWNFISG